MHQTIISNQPNTLFNCTINKLQKMPLPETPFYILNIILYTDINIYNVRKTKNISSNRNWWNMHEPIPCKTAEKMFHSSNFWTNQQQRINSFTLFFKSAIKFVFMRKSMTIIFIFDINFVIEFYLFINMFTGRDDAKGERLGEGVGC